MPRKLTGHIEHRYKSSITIVINTKPERTFISVKTTDDREATKELYRIIDEMERGVYVQPTDKTLGEYLDEWMEFKSVGKKKLSYNTKRRYKGMIENYFKPDMGNIPLQSLQPLRIQEHYKWLQSEDEGCPGLEEQTARKHHNMLHHALKWAVKWGLIFRNPTDFVDPPSALYDYEAPILEDKQSIQEMLQKVIGTVLYLPALIGITCGMREGEICGLRWRDMNRKTGVFIVRHSLYREYGVGLVLGLTKNKRKHPVKIPKTTLKTLLHEYATRYEGSENEDHGDDYICCWPEASFRGPKGRPLCPQWLSHKFTKLGLNLTFHGLRHSHDSLLYNSGIDSKRVADRSGRDVVLTEKKYEHILKKKQDELANVVEDFIFAPDNPPENDANIDSGATK
jgi:integrase